MKPEDSCPICGEYLPKASEETQVYFNHECPEATLNAINSANTRAINETQNPDWNRSGRIRLAEGFEIMALSERD